MNEITSNNALTFENVWASIQESKRYLTELFAETDRRMKETDRRMKETDQRMKETDRIMKENAEQQKETARQMKETDRRLEEYFARYERARMDYERRMKNMEGRVGAWAKNHGSFAEEYFYNSFENDETNFFGETFDDIGRNVIYSTKTQIGEFDIVLYNHTTIAIIEVKYKAHFNDIEKVLKKAKTFRELCPYYDSHKVYLGLASLCFYDELEEKCKENGIAIIKQVGDKVVICDEYLRVF